MLLATSSSGQCINLAEDWKKPDLERIRTLNTFQCPVCKNNVTLKLGTKRIWHFSHLKDASCRVETEPESTYHLLGKRQLYRWLSVQKLHPGNGKVFPSYEATSRSIPPQPVNCLRISMFHNPDRGFRQTNLLLP
ncbi:competence protein CoiA family protein [Pseudalkalibacillus sp. A8]|uniref:competence protein CoiA family protein n=1 Tax=Pseudalkalibacillus sp. A8 TaxID=3382641 RepID=UPI0038B4D6B3